CFEHKGLCSSYSFFFFQAEDGIRDLYVTGVQTCALPISRILEPVAIFQPGAGGRLHADQVRLGMSRPGMARDRLRGDGAESEARSEERRVGKECRAGWSRCQ